MTWRAAHAPALDSNEMEWVHQLHAFLGAVGCTNQPRINDLYNAGACGRAKYRWLDHCRLCHRAIRAVRTSGVDDVMKGKDIPSAYRESASTLEVCAAPGAGR